MATIHVSEAEAAKDFAGLMERVRNGDEVVIEQADKAIAVLRDPDSGEFKPRNLSESLAIAQAIEKERGHPAVMDEDFAADMREIIANRSQWKMRDWE
jgi:antitoxin (DNA-binding transcriptional repressor) of toxin-antitoxin stability system